MVETPLEKKYFLMQNNYKGKSMINIKINNYEPHVESRVLNTNLALVLKKAVRITKCLIPNNVSTTKLFDLIQ